MKNTLSLEKLSDFTAIRSISADSKYKMEMIKALEFLSRELGVLGFKSTIMGDDSHPKCIIASLFVSESAPTIGIYGHYDVQPADPVDEWRTDPFTLSLKNGKIYGRGVADNKGHVIQNITAIGNLIKSGSLKSNIVFLIEGEEEVGSTHLEEYIKAYGHTHPSYAIDLKSVGVWYITDTGMRGVNEPQIFYGLRGLAYFELKLTTGKRDLHSGVYGNRVLNPIQVLSELLSGMRDQVSGKVTIPGFYDGLRKFTAAELNELRAVCRSDQEELDEAQVYQLVTQDKLPYSLVTKILPSFDINGIIGGYSGPGSKTIIPCEASAKFSFRLVEGQRAADVARCVQSYIDKALPKGVKYELVEHSLTDPFYSPINDPHIISAADILSKTFGNKTIFNRSGGSIPAAEIFQRLFGTPAILTGFTLPDDHIHAPNENFDEAMFYKGIEALELLYSA